MYSPAKILTVILLAVAPSFAQTDRIRDTNFNSWFMYFGDHKVSQKWGVHLEGQYRRNSIGQKPQQLLLRPGINYDINSNVMLTAGYAYVYTTPYGDHPIALSFPEHRLFEQALVRHKIGKVAMSHRYRLEQRFLGETGLDSEGDIEVNNWRRENRFRYMVRANIPLQGEMAKGKWYLGLYDEILVNFGKNVSGNFFDQNRAYAALGYGLGKIGNFEAGYLQQTILRRHARVVEYNHTLQFAVYSNFSFIHD